MIILSLFIICFTIIAIALVIAWAVVASKGTKIKDLEKRIEELERRGNFS